MAKAEEGVKEEALYKEWDWVVDKGWNKFSKGLAISPRKGIDREQVLERIRRQWYRKHRSSHLPVTPAGETVSTLPELKESSVEERVEQIVEETVEEEEMTGEMAEQQKTWLDSPRIRLSLIIVWLMLNLGVVWSTLRHLFSFSLVSKHFYMTWAFAFGTYCIDVVTHHSLTFLNQEAVLDLLSNHSLHYILLCLILVWHPRGALTLSLVVIPAYLNVCQHIDANISEKTPLAHALRVDAWFAWCAGLGMMIRLLCAHLELGMVVVVLAWGWKDPLGTAVATVVYMSAFLRLRWLYSRESRVAVQQWRALGDNIFDHPSAPRWLRFSYEIVIGSMQFPTSFHGIIQDANRRLAEE